MHYYRCTISYDGTDFHGWQAQTNKRGVINILQHSFKTAFSHDVAIVGASRTDSGVHALGQIARIKTTLDLDPEIIQAAWNNRLPLSVCIVSMQRVPHTFHPMFKVRQKTYRYHFFAQRPSPLHARYGWHVTFRIDIEKLKAALELFVGTHDFRSFTSSDGLSSSKDTVRTVDSITMSFVESMNAYCIEVKGKSFLHHMIRRMVGAAMDIATHPEMDNTAIINALESPTPRQQLYNAPACGLTLYRVDYE